MDQLSEENQSFIQEFLRKGLQVSHVVEGEMGDLSFSFRVIAKPCSKKERLFIDKGGGIVIALSAKPVDGEANGAIFKVLGKLLGLPASKMTLEKGLKSKIKQFRVSFTFTDHKRQDYYLKKWNMGFS